MQTDVLCLNFYQSMIQLPYMFSKDACASHIIQTINDVEWLKVGKQARDHSTKQFSTQTLYGHLFLHYMQGDFMLNCLCYDPYLVPYFFAIFVVPSYILYIFNVIFFGSKCMLELKFVIYHSAAEVVCINVFYKYMWKF